MAPKMESKLTFIIKKKTLNCAISDNSKQGGNLLKCNKN